MKKPAQKKILKRASRKKNFKKSPKKALKSFDKIVRKIKSRINRIAQKPVERPPGRPTGIPFPSAPENGLPQKYGEDEIVLLVRDPWWLYACWEVTPAREREVLNGIRGQGLEREKTVLRVYDLTEGDLPQAPFFDIETGFADNWYVDVGKPGREWVAELGIRTRKGRFFELVRSNRVRTPHFGLSDVLDPEWMGSEELYQKLLGASPGGNSSEMRLLFAASP